MKTVKINKEFINLDKIYRVIDKMEESDTIVLLFDPLIEENAGVSGTVWASLEVRGEEAKSLLDYLNRNSYHIS